MRSMHSISLTECYEIFFRYILEAETHVKSLISYYFSEAHGHKNYLVYTNFNTALRDSESKITSLIAEIQRQTATHSNDPSISHYLKTHGYIPLWVLNNILTLGTISKFYSLMLPQERQNISRCFNIMDKELESALTYISTVRNFVLTEIESTVFEPKSLYPQHRIINN